MECLLGEQSVCSPSARFFGEIPKKPCTLNKSKRPPTVDIAGFLICSADIKYCFVKFIEDNMGVPHEDIIVFGDSENDVEMLKYAATSVIMNHAPDFLDEYATLRTESDENGVAEGLAKLLDL